MTKLDTFFWGVIVGTVVAGVSVGVITSEVAESQRQQVDSLGNQAEQLKFESYGLKKQQEVLLRQLEKVRGM